MVGYKISYLIKQLIFFSQDLFEAFIIKSTVTVLLEYIDHSRPVNEVIGK